MDQDYSEKRRYPRKNTAITSLCIKRDLEQKKIEMDIVPIRNIAQEGVFLQTDVPYIKGTLVEVQFIVPDNPRPMAIKGKVMWFRNIGNRPGMGIQFVSISDRDKDELIRYLEKL
ncbi:MAG: PilZ domain-containing protein [bacterium]